MRAAPRSGLAGLATDLLACLALFALALLIRLQGLLTVPRFTDEQLDVLYTLPLYRLQAVPIVAFDPYNGPLFSMLLAATMWLIGPEPAAPRLLVALIGSATVVATAALGFALGGRLAGWVAAGLMATCAAHVVVNSHVAWSNATTPFFSTLAFLALQCALRRRSGPLLALTGLLLGVALQTHPSIVAFLPGVALVALVRLPGIALVRVECLGRRRPLPGPWAIGAGLLFLLAYGNMIAYNLNPSVEAGYQQAVTGLVPEWRVSPEGLLARLARESGANAEAGSGLMAYPSSVGALALSLPRVMAGLIEPRASVLDHLLTPSLWVYAPLALIGLFWPLRRGALVPALVGGSYLLLLPLFNAKYEPIFNARYFMPALPLIFAGIGLALSDLTGMARGWRWKLAAVGAILVLLSYPMLPLNAYLRRQSQEGQINLELIASTAVLQSERRGGEPILLDEALGRRNLAADGDLLMCLKLFLELRREASRVLPISANRLEAELAATPSALLAVSQPHDRSLDERFRLTQLEERTTGRYAIYRVERR